MPKTHHIRRYLGLFLLLAVIISCYFLFHLRLQPKQKNTDDKPQQLGNELHYTLIDQAGKLTQDLRSKQMQYNSKTDQADLIQPTLKLHTRDGGTWLISADRGKRSQADQVQLYGHVRITQRINNRTTTHITTSTMTVWPQKKQATTRAEAIIRHGNAEFHSKGFHIDLSKSVLKLLAHTRGKYSRAKQR